MDTVAHTLNAVLVALFDAISFPLKGLDPFWSLSFISIGFGPLVVLAVGRLSHQERIAQVRKSIMAKILGLRLFQRDPGVMLRIQVGILGDLLSYTRLWLKPAALLLVPFCLVAIQLMWRYSISGVAAGDAVVVKVYARPWAAPLSRDGVRLTSADGRVSIETAAVHLPSQREIAWRVRPRSEGVHRLIVHIGDRQLEKSLVAGSEASLLASVRTGRGLVDLLLHPGERPIGPDEPLEAIEIVYPEAELSVLGWRTHWMLPFLLLSVISGYFSKGWLGVEI